MAASRDDGDLLSTINPDDIANISILKGPNAARYMVVQLTTVLLLSLLRADVKARLKLIFPVI